MFITVEQMTYYHWIGVGAEGKGGGRRWGRGAEGERVQKVREGAEGERGGQKHGRGSEGEGRGQMGREGARWGREPCDWFVHGGLSWNYTGMPDGKKTTSLDHFFLSVCIGVLVVMEEYAMSWWNIIERGLEECLWQFISCTCQFVEELLMTILIK